MWSLHGLQVNTHPSARSTSSPGLGTHWAVSHTIYLIPQQGVLLFIKYISQRCHQHQW